MSSILIFTRNLLRTSNRIAIPSTQSVSPRLSNRDIMSSIMFSAPTISSFRSLVAAAILESSPRRMPGGKFNDALINIGGYLTRCYITANIHFPNSCSDAFSTCFETSTLKITSISKLQCCISLKFDMFNIQIKINKGNMFKGCVHTMPV